MIKEGSVLGGVLLIAGSCIGAGMLALPVITGVGGFGPAIALFVVAWLFMATTGLLLLEANLTLGHELSLISIAEKTLGKGGKVLTWILFLFLFYCLSIAYIAASGSILETIVFDLFGKKVPLIFGSLFFTLVFGMVLLVGTRFVDYLNRLLMLGLIVSYLFLVGLGTALVNPEFLTTVNWKASLGALPVIIISFGFHNMIPSLAMYLKGDAKRLRLTVTIGSFIPLLFYLLWEAVMLGLIPLQGREGLLSALDKGKEVTSVLYGAVGKSWTLWVAELFALFAIVTSFLAQSLSLVDFLADGLKMSKVGMKRVVLVLLTLLPPFVFAYIYPGIFIEALNIAGGFSAVILFGVLPVFMIYVLRYKRKIAITPIIPSGKGVLLVVFLIALGVFCLELAQELGYSFIPSNVEAVP